jgi:ferredoxin-NADP reductase
MAVEPLPHRFARALVLDRALRFWADELPLLQRFVPPRDTERVRVLRVVDESHDVKTFVFERPASWPRHRAGQWLPIDVEVDGARVRRCYSLTSLPYAGHLAVTVKRVPGGRVSGWMHTHVRAGDVVHVGAPSGEFVVPPGTQPLLLVGGGSGMTPVIAIVRDLAERGALADVIVVQCARTRADLLFARELERLAERHRGLRVVFHVDAESAGPLAAEVLHARVPDLAFRETFVCGPAGLMDALAAYWKAHGLLDRLHREDFVPSFAAKSSGEVGARLRLSRSGREVVAATKGSLLEVLEAAGERPAFGCRMGVCNTCSCRKRSGAVTDLRTGEVSHEPDQQIRLCVSAAASDLDLAL